MNAITKDSWLMLFPGSDQCLFLIKNFDSPPQRRGHDGWWWYSYPHGVIAWCQLFCSYHGTNNVCVSVHHDDDDCTFDIFELCTSLSYGSAHNSVRACDLNSKIKHWCCSALVQAFFRSRSSVSLMHDSGKKQRMKRKQTCKGHASKEWGTHCMLGNAGGSGNEWLSDCRDVS